MQKITVEKMVFGGHGLARTDSGVLFVENGMPGEILDVVPESKKHDCVIVKPVRFVKTSDHRREPPCRYSGVCGGCDWLFIDYSQQLLFKRDIFIDCLRRIGKLDNLPEPEVFGSPEFRYRLRAQIKIGDNGICGFYRKKSNDIVSINHCPLLCDQINELLKNIPVISDKVNCGNLKLIAGDSSITSDPVLSGVTFSSAIITVAGYKFNVTGDSFFQSNRFLLEKLGTWAIPHVRGRTCVDLYGGTGFFSVMLSSGFEKGILIESVQNQVTAAQRNFEANRLNQFKAVHAEAEQVKGIIAGVPDLLIIDPPRPGLTRKAREQIAMIGAKKILYVSCNPSTQSRDVGFFVKSCGFRILNMALFDLYPNTHHMETAILLEKN